VAGLDFTSDFSLLTFDLIARQRFTVPLPNRPPLLLGERTLVMAIVNVTPDSFADGGARLDPDVAAREAIRLVEQGADILDIGREYTGPGGHAGPAGGELS